MYEDISLQLEKEGLLKSPSGFMRERLLWIAASISAICIAFFTGLNISNMTNESIGGNKYLLLLHEDQNYSFGDTSIEDVIAEYSDWAENLGKEGKLVSAEKLTEEVQTLGKVPKSASPATGYFVITASSLEEAMKISKSHPHLRYNGGIEIRPVDNVN